MRCGTEENQFIRKSLRTQWGFFYGRRIPGIKRVRDDVSGVLQGAIGRLLKEQSYGILYIPEGEYRLKNTVKIPPSVRLIGYGKNRPVFVLPKEAEGYDGGIGGDESNVMQKFRGGYPGAKYMFWFIGEKDYTLEEPKDADAATFYSAISNIDFRIEGKASGSDLYPGAFCTARFYQSLPF